MTTLLTISDTAKILKVTTRTVHTYLKRGLPHIKVGGVVRISADDLSSWFLSHRRGTTSPLTPELLGDSRGGITPTTKLKSSECQKQRGTSSLF